jgi:hypothetical protein
MVLNGAQFRLPLSAYSGDMHKVIEHAHGTVTAAFQKSLYQKPQLCTPEQYQEEMYSVAHKVVTPESVRKDVESLKPLYQTVIDIKGHWPNKKLR